MLIDGTGVPSRLGGGTQEDGGRKEKLFNTSTGKKHSKGEGERSCCCRSLLVFFWGIQMIWMRAIEHWKEKVVVHVVRD